jgi:hypothetical protein
MHTVRRRFWVEAAAAVVTGVMLVVTAIAPDWIERLWEVEPDGGDGSLEWMLVGVLALVTITLVVAARVEWTRAQRLTTN